MWYLAEHSQRATTTSGSARDGEGEAARQREGRGGGRPAGRATRHARGGGRPVVQGRTKGGRAGARSRRPRFPPAPRGFGRPCHARERATREGEAARWCKGGPRADAPAQGRGVLDFRRRPEGSADRATRGRGRPAARGTRWGEAGRPCQTRWGEASGWRKDGHG